MLRQRNVSSRSDPLAKRGEHRIPGNVGSVVAMPVEAIDSRPELQRRLSVVLLAAFTIFLLTASFAPFNAWYFAYVALVPWVVILSCSTHRRWALLWAVATGLIFWALNLYWLWWITLEGYAASVAYLTMYWVVAAVAVRAAARRNWPMWIVLPAVWVALEYARNYVISGFPWFFLAHSQYARTRLIQIADLTGQYGVSFFVAMVNGALADLIAFRWWASEAATRSRRWTVAAGLAAVVVAGGAILVYGGWRLSQQTTRPGPVIGIVQQAFPITLFGRDASPEEIFDRHLRESRQLVGAGCDLVLWPETMLPSGMNAEFLDIDETSLGPRGQEILSELRGQARQMGELSAALDCPILAGGSTLRRNPTPINEDDHWLIGNSTLWFDRSERPSGIYSKMHMVPFSEYVPFKSSWPWLHQTLRRFVPPVMEQLEPGDQPVTFSLERRGQRWSLASPICYEGTFADLCRDLVMRDGRKAAGVLANLSNDGWFVWRWRQGPWHGSTEHSQHMVQYCFRAVETRTPVIRSVNTGISASIDSCGRIAAVLTQGGMTELACGTLVLDGAVDRQGDTPEGHGPKVLVDDRVTVYSLVGDAFARGVCAAAVAMCLVPWRWKHRRKKRQ